MWLSVAADNEIARRYHDPDHYQWCLDRRAAASMCWVTAAKIEVQCLQGVERNIFCICMHACTHTHRHTHIHTHRHMHTQPNNYAHTCARICTHIHVSCMHAHADTYTVIHIKYVQQHKHTRAHTYTNTYTPKTFSCIHSHHV